MQSLRARRRAPHSCSLGFELGHGILASFCRAPRCFHHVTRSCNQGAAHVLSPLHHMGTLVTGAKSCSVVRIGWALLHGLSLLHV